MEFESDLAEFFVAGNRVFHHDEQLLQLHGDLHDGREDDEELGALLPSEDGVGQLLHHHRVVEEPMVVVEESHLCGVGGLLTLERVGGIAGPIASVDVHASGAVPRDHAPLLFLAEFLDLGFGFVRLVGLHPHAGERRRDHFTQLVGQTHGLLGSWGGCGWFAMHR